MLAFSQWPSSTKSFVRALYGLRVILNLVWTVSAQNYKDFNLYPHILINIAVAHYILIKYNTIQCYIACGARNSELFEILNSPCFHFEHFRKIWPYYNRNSLLNKFQIHLTFSTLHHFLIVMWPFLSQNNCGIFVSCIAGLVIWVWLHSTHLQGLVKLISIVHWFYYMLSESWKKITFIVHI